MNLYVMFDRLAEESGPIFEAKNDAVARRSAKFLLKDADLADYQLLRVGTFDHKSQALKAEPVPAEVSL